jgi:uncharacterized protein
MSADASPAVRSVAVTGASGFVGSALIDHLAALGHDVVALSRSPRAGGGPRVRWAAYDPLSPTSCRDAVQGCDAVVHLAGEGLFDRRWSKARMAALRASRVDGTRALVEGIALASPRPRVLVSGSAIGYYGPRPPDVVLDESSPPGDDFLAELCVAWEREAHRAGEQGLRVACSRTGIVLGRGGGALKKMALPFKMFVGGPIGSGKQATSWIHLHDMVGLLAAAALDGAWRGPFNATAPKPVTNRELSKALGHALHRPSFLPAPAFALRIALGKVAGILTTGQRVIPKVALDHGFPFAFPTIEQALSDLVAKP